MRVQNKLGDNWDALGNRKQGGHGRDVIFKQLKIYSVTHGIIITSDILCVNMLRKKEHRHKLGQAFGTIVGTVSNSRKDTWRSQAVAAEVSRG